MLTSQEIDDIISALRMRCNYIETGTVVLSAADALASGRQKLVKGLEPSQIQLITRIHALVTKLNIMASQLGEDNQ